MKRRHGFTLVELLVSMALIIFMMAILSQAFIAALGTFRNLKGQGDMAEKLRASMQILQSDLAANHFDGSRRLSDPNFWSNGPPTQGFFQIYEGPPNQAAPIWGSFSEGAPPTFADADSWGSWRTTNHALSFTVKQVGNDMGNFMTASGLGSGNVWNLVTLTPNVPQLPSNNPAYPNGLGIGAIQLFGPPENRYQPLIGSPNITGYNSQWAAVAWFLQPQGRIDPSTGIFVQDQTVTDPNTGAAPVPLFQLYRRQAMLVPDNGLVALSTTPIGGVPSTLLGTNFLEMSCLPDPTSTMIYFNSPNDITMPSNRFWGGQGPFGCPNPAGVVPLPPLAYLPIPAGAPGLLQGSDIQLNDVVSFDVRMMMTYDLSSTAGGFTDPFVTLWQVPFFQTPGGGWNNANPAYNTQLTFNGTQPLVFDTWSSNAPGYSNWNLSGAIAGTKAIPLWNPNTIPPSGFNPNPIPPNGPIIKAIQVTIRIWDFKTNQSRQVTIVQAM